ncbi:MAG: hypothetical protein OZ914_03960 [Anaerolineaceae bacterium]|jgi:hypothetical protein|nr:hypothetical protein [Anaerolineaceae bacterium]OQY89699.1 MAG: hypothetical protein B6D38_05910 [Anaerolineae bacterium UTCFX1]
MNKNIPTAKQPSLKKILWAILAMAIISLVVLSVFLKNNTVNSQGQVASPSATLPANQGVVSSASPTPYPKDFPQLSVNIDQVAIFQDRYFMHGTLNLNDATNGSVDNIDVSEMILTDSTGKQIPIEPLDFRLDPSAGMEFSFYTQGKGVSEMLTLTVSSADFHFEGDQISSPGFEVDFGNNPQKNQEWSLNSDFVLAGHRVRLSSVKALMKDGVPFLEFTMIGTPEVRGVLVSDMSVQSFSGDDFYTAFQDGQIITLFRYANGFPRGKHQFAFDLVSFSVQGNWQIGFDPASIDKQPSAANSEFHNACFLNENWMNRELILTEIPAELSGTLLVDNRFVSLDSISMATIDLRGGEKQERNGLSWQAVAFSPDGTMIVYYDWQAHKGHITNLYSGEEKEYVWNKAPSNRISWLTGSDLIAYDSDDGIYISHVDGTGLYKVNGTDGETLLSGWLPDEQHLLVSRTSYKSPMLLQMLTTTNGETKDLFSFSSSYITAAIPSPDGKKVLFEDTVERTQQQGIFIANLDGSERHLIASFWRMLIGSYAWSPDGKWVIVSVTDVKHGNEMTSFLINPDSCDTIRLSNIDWEVRAWAPLP